MKKALFILLVLLSTLLAFTSCGGDEPGEVTPPSDSEKPDDSEKPGDGEKPGDSEKPGKPTALDKLGALSGLDYSEITLTVETVTYGQRLVAAYVLHADGRVDYRVEQLAPLSPDADANADPDGDGLTVITGTVSKDELPTVTDGGVSIPAAGELRPGFGFDPRYLSVKEESDGRLTAEVTDVSGFLGREVECTGMTLEVEFTADQLSAVTVAYATDISEVTLRYELTK